jgi:hypothetical protein
VCRRRSTKRAATRNTSIVPIQKHRSRKPSLSLPTDCGQSSHFTFHATNILRLMAWSGGYLTRPTSLRLTQLAQDAYDLPFGKFENTHDSRSSLGQLCLLVLLAVSEVLCITLTGYIVARLGHFDAEKRKFLSNLNVMLFTPCLSMLALCLVPLHQVEEC